MKKNVEKLFSLNRSLQIKKYITLNEDKDESIASGMRKRLTFVKAEAQPKKSTASASIFLKN